MEIKYDRIGNDYNQTRKADPYLTDRLFNLIDANHESSYLDIGCGTGNYTIALHNKGMQLIGIDPSDKMLTEAKKKCDAIDWQIGNAESISLPTNSIDGIVASLTLHHWESLEKGFTELSRVLKEDGRIVILTATPQQMEGYWLNHFFPKMLHDSIIQMPSYELVEVAMKKAGLAITTTEKYFIKDDLEDCFLYSGKNRPELYLKSEIRNGISSFSDLANLEEVKNGLVQLEEAIKDGSIQDIINRYENDLGDYLFIVGEKK